jgi:hypothetical protein
MSPACLSPFFHFVCVCACVGSRGHTGAQIFHHTLCTPTSLVSTRTRACTDHRWATLSSSRAASARSLIATFARLHSSSTLHMSTWERKVHLYRQHRHRRRALSAVRRNGVWCCDSEHGGAHGWVHRRGAQPLWHGQRATSRIARCLTAAPQVVLLDIA